MINLHTNVYPCKSGADHVLTGAKRSRECAGQDKHVPVDSKEHHTHASCAASCSGLLGDDAVASKSATSTHTTSERSTRALKGCVAGGKQDSAFKAFDEELRRFVGTRRDDTLEIAGAGAGACEFESGREFVFSDLVRDSKVLDAARRALAAGTLSLNTRAGAGAGAGTGAGVGSGGVSYIHDSVPTRPCSSVTSTAPDLVGGTRWHAPAGRNSSTCALE